MNGQRIGNFTGSNSGKLILDLDDAGDHYRGYAFVFDSNPLFPPLMAAINTRDKASKFVLDVPVAPMDPATGNSGKWDDLKKNYGSVNCPTKATINLNFVNQVIEATWTTDIGTHGTCSLLRSKADDPTDYVPEPDVNNWTEFKEFIKSFEFRRFIFRGQLEPKRLRTGFHRTGRADLFHFMNNDIPTLYRHLSSKTKHIFNLGIPEQNGAFFNLLQHHGYPTPLLDWTYSPYVSAFFAYRSITNAKARECGPDKKVRIFIFDQKNWRQNQPQKISLTGQLHFSIMEFIAIENDRLVPQQSISSVTNVDDIESHIRRCETPENKYLRIIDLPLSERPKVMSDLSVMGITAGSLFPGLDGACEELKERNFSL